MISLKMVVLYVRSSFKLVHKNIFKKCLKNIATCCNEESNLHVH